MQRRVLCQRRKVAGIHRQSPLWQRGVLELPCIEETFVGVFLRTVKKVGLERVVKDVLMRLWGVQKGCVKIAELIVSILFAPVAQRIERRFPKPCVGGSSPLKPTTYFLVNKKVSKENFTCGFAAKEFSQFCTLKTEQYESKSNNRGNVKMLFRS